MPTATPTSLFAFGAKTNQNATGTFTFGASKPMSFGNGSDPSPFATPFLTFSTNSGADVKDTEPPNSLFGGSQEVDPAVTQVTNTSQGTEPVTNQFGEPIGEPKEADPTPTATPAESTSQEPKYDHPLFGGPSKVDIAPAAIQAEGTSKEIKPAKSLFGTVEAIPTPTTTQSKSTSQDFNHFCGNGEEEREGCSIERAPTSDYIQ
jgi:hypothetical protein